VRFPGTDPVLFSTARRNIETLTYVYDKNTGLLTDMTPTAWRIATGPGPASSEPSSVAFSGQVTIVSEVAQNRFEAAADNEACRTG
jgi:hypothetical protein